MFYLLKKNFAMSTRKAIVGGDRITLPSRYRCKVKVDNQLVLNVDLLYSQGPYQVKEGAVSVRLTPGLGNRGVLFVRKGSQPPKLGTMDFLKEDILPMPSSYPSETHARILIFTTVKFEVILFANIDK